jgi:quinol-cytochrome oxidoreductase complex cytochrome b subunit
LMWHIVLLPMVVVALTGVHVLMVRRRGIVPPFAVESDTPSSAPNSLPADTKDES